MSNQNIVFVSRLNEKEFMERKRLEYEKEKEMFGYQIQLRMDSLKHKYVAIREAEARKKVNRDFKKEIKYHIEKNEFLENRIQLQ